MVATNVAETSITIDDVTAVIDAGRVKQMGYDSSRGIACLQVPPIPQSPFPRPSPNLPSLARGVRC